MSARARRWLAVAAGALVLATLWALPTLALACPACATRTDTGGVPLAVVIASFISFPFGVAFIALRTIRRAVQDEKNATSSSRRAAASS